MILLFLMELRASTIDAIQQTYLFGIFYHFYTFLENLRTKKNFRKNLKIFRPDQPYASLPVAEWPSRPPNPH